MTTFRNTPGSLALLILFVMPFSAGAETREAKQNKARSIFYEFPKDTIQCRRGDYVIRESDDHLWRVFHVEDIFFLSRLIPFDEQGSEVLVEQIDFADSAPPPKWKEIHLLVSEFEKGHNSIEEAFESIKRGQLGHSVRGLLRGISEFPKAKSRVYRKPS